MSREPPGRVIEGPVLEGTFVDGKYRIERLLALGGMGAVYRAEHVHEGRPVALKVLLPRQRRGAGRFYRESRLAMAVHHPNVVHTFDRGMLPDGMPYLVMELLEGRTLGERLREEEALSVRAALMVAAQVLSALAAAHAHDVIHRDLKPDNVFLVGETGASGSGPVHAKLFDFGISRSRHETAALTLDGAVVGTPEYISPEQAQGRRDIDHRTDLWSAGVLLYESLLGRVPFRGDNLHRLIVGILQEPPVPPSAVCPSIPPALEAVILRALEKRPEDRFPSALSMLEAVRSAAADAGVVHRNDAAHG